MRVLQRRDRLRLAIEALLRRRVVRPLGRQHFDRDDAIEARVAGFVDLAHAARAEGAENLVGAESGACS
jgi:hypothetical protein